MPLSEKKAETSPFSKEGLTAGKKRAFIVVSFLAAASFLCMIYGLYIDFFRSPAITATYYLTAEDKNVSRQSLIDPQPPEKKTEPKNVQGESAELIERLEQEKKTMEKTAVALQEMVATVPEQPVLPESPALRQLQREKDLNDQKKLDEIANLQKERDELENKKLTALDDLEAALAAFEAVKSEQTEQQPVPAAPPAEKPAADTEKKTKLPAEPAASETGSSQKLKLTAPGHIPVIPYDNEVPPPDLIKTNLIDSLPDFALIKKGTPANAIPLHIIDPLPELQEDSRYGKLPVKNGNSTPFLAYSRQVNLPPQTPYIAVLFSGLGKRTNATEAAINTLPEIVSLSFSPYADKLKNYIAAARRTGHETLLDMPMQRGVFPDTDPGPLGLVSGLPEQENRKRLHKVLGQSVALIGVSAAAKENFSYSGTQMKPFFDEIIQRGLVYIDGTDNPRMPKFKKAVRPDVHIAENFHRAAIRARLEQARQIALKTGSAFIRVETVPITLLVVEEWIKSFAPTEEKPVPEITFVPLSYYVQQKEAEK